MTHKLKIFRERPQAGVGCCTLKYTDVEKKTFPGYADQIAAAELYMKLRKEYKDKLDVEFYDPRCFTFLIFLFLYRIRGNEVTWVLDNKVVYRGIPDWDKLKGIIDEKVA